MKERVLPEVVMPVVWTDHERRSGEDWRMTAGSEVDHVRIGALLAPLVATERTGTGTGAGAGLLDAAMGSVPALYSAKLRKPSLSESSAGLEAPVRAAHESLTPSLLASGMGGAASGPGVAKE
ncbi:MAG: hypothetical protein DVB22_002599 [Verrucomicrobia bacterium]|nr:MAG: hypothetical protein DVB22_002599 [Verrucomicrobiota bacterium]